MAFVVFTASLFPGLVYLYFVYRLDRYEPEPKSWVALLFCLGMAAGNFAAILEIILKQAFPILNPSAALTSSFAPVIPVLVLQHVGFVAPIEEFAKLLPFLIVFFNRRLFNEPIDGFVYAAAVALGFASIENAFYAFSSTVDILIPRSLLAIPTHVLASGIWGMGLAYFRFVRPDWRGFIVVVLSLLGGILLHGFYNVLVGIQGYFFAGLLLIVTGGTLVIPFRRFRRRSPFRTSLVPNDEVDNIAACRSCGKAGRSGEPCPACGDEMQALRSDAPRPSLFRPGWTIGSILILGALAALIAAGAPNVDPSTSMYFAAAVIFVGSALIGVISRGVTIAEPAVAGVIATIIYVLLIGSRSEHALTVAPIGFVLAVTGAWLGEKFQGHSTADKRGKRGEGGEGGEGGGEASSPPASGD